MIPVVWRSYKIDVMARGYWDQSILDALFKNELWNPVNRYEFESCDDIPDGATGAVVIIPGRYHYDCVDQINADISKLKWCLLIIAGDEEAKFDVDQITHPNIVIYLMTPHAGKAYKNVNRYIGEGWPPHARELINTCDGEKYLSWSFTGQVTHKRRKECVQTLSKMENGRLVPTSKFIDTENGLDPTDYYRLLAGSKVAPCPSGPETPDTFRFYEALEAGCVPIADAIATNNDNPGYWNLLFGEYPFPTIKDWADAKDLIQFHADVFPQTNNRVFAWWQGQKRKMAYDLIADINYLTGEAPKGVDLKDKITVLIPTSPISTHPDTSIIEEAIGTVRSKLPDSEIIIMIDGVRSEQSMRTADYEEYIRRLLWKTNFQYKNVLPIIFNQHSHQVKMTREALKLVKTPMILFMEHDTPITPDCEFEWPGLMSAILHGHAHMIRFHFESHILDVHKHLMLSDQQMIDGVPLVPTSQWSQRPHLASIDFYRNILDRYFSANAISMIEDGIHGKVQEAYEKRGRAGWDEFKTWIYAPDGNMKRSYHTDGRKHDPKFDGTFIY